MIKEVTGDILLSKAELIAHGIAPNDHFGQGLALALREKHPALHKDFRHHIHQSHPKCGEVWLWEGDGIKIANLFTQEAALSEKSHPGKATLANVNHCLHALKKIIAAKKIKSLSLPKLASGVGGLEWEEVKKLITSILGDGEVKVVIYSLYKAGVAAQE